MKLCLWHLFLLSSLLGAISCSENRGSIYIGDVDSRKWTKGKPVYLYADNTDTLATKDLYLIVRFSEGFRYDKLLLEIETLSPDRVYWNDTVSISFTPSKGAGEYHEVKDIYRREAILGKQGNYRFAVRHLMRDSLLPGVAGVGIEIK